MSINTILTNWFEYVCEQQNSKTESSNLVFPNGARYNNNLLDKIPLY